MSFSSPRQIKYFSNINKFEEYPEQAPTNTNSYLFINGNHIKLQIIFYIYGDELDVGAGGYARMPCSNNRILYITSK